MREERLGTAESDRRATLKLTETPTALTERPTAFLPGEAAYGAG